MPATVENILIEQGSTFTMTSTVTTDGVTPMDLTGFQGRGQIKLKATDATPLATFTVDITTPADGLVTITLPATDSSAIVTKGATYKDKLTAVYDVEIYKNNTVIRLLNGTAAISPEITK